MTNKSEPLSDVIWSTYLENKKKPNRYISACQKDVTLTQFRRRTHQCCQQDLFSRSRPRPRLFCQHQDQDQDLFSGPRGASRPKPCPRGLQHCQEQNYFVKTKTFFQVLEAPRDQDHVLEDYSTGTHLWKSSNFQDGLVWILTSLLLHFWQALATGADLIISVFIHKHIDPLFY
jgi:hypothetical protein